MNNFKNYQQFKQFIINPLVAEKDEGAIYGVSYTRVSSKDQFEKNGSIESQAKMCLNLAEKNGIHVLEKFGGTFESAKSEERKEFKRMMQFINNSSKKIKYIIVSDNDRFSRTGGNAIYLTAQLRKKGIQVIAASAPVDTSTPTGAFQQNIQLLFSHFDNEMRREKTIRGMKQKYSKGIFFGKPPIGYDSKIINGETEITISEQGKLLAKAFKWKAEQNMPTIKIATQLNKLGLKITDKKLSWVFKNVFYCGLLTNKMLGNEIIDGKNWQPIVSKDLFLSANEVLNSNHIKYTNRKQDQNLPLKHNIHCEKCQTAMTGYIVRKKNIYYYKCNTKGCGSNKNANKVHQGFVSLLNQYQIDPELLPLVKQQLAFSIQCFGKSIEETTIDNSTKINEIKGRIEKLEERFVTGEIDRALFDKFNQKFLHEIAQLIPETAPTKINLSNPKTIAEKCLDLSQNLSKIWVCGDNDEKQALQKVVFTDSIYYNTGKSIYRTPKVNSVFSQIALLAGNLKGIETKNPLSFSGDSHQVVSTNEISNSLLQDFKILSDLRAYLLAA